MDQKERLEQKLANLQAEYKLLIDKLPYLRRDRVLAIDASAKFKLDYDIAEAQSQLTQVEEEMDRIEKLLKTAAQKEPLNMSQTARNILIISYYKDKNY